MRKNTSKFADEIAEVMEKYGFEFDDAYAVVVYASENEFYDDPDNLEDEDDIDEIEVEDEDIDEDEDEDADEDTDEDADEYEDEDNEDEDECEVEYVATVSTKSATVKNGRFTIPSQLIKDFADDNLLTWSDSMVSFLADTGDKIVFVSSNDYYDITNYGDNMSDDCKKLIKSIKKDIDVDISDEDVVPYSKSLISSTKNGNKTISSKTFAVPQESIFVNDEKLYIHLINLDDSISYILVANEDLTF